MKVYLLKLFIGISLLTISEVSGAEIQSVKFVGGAGNYINIQSRVHHSLQCNFRSGYDDPVKYVRWYKDDRKAYEWKSGSSVSIAFSDLAGRVETNGNINLQHLHFGSPSLNFDGSYVCEVVSKSGSVRSNPHLITVVDIPSDNYTTKVSLVETVYLENDNLRSNSNSSNNCTLVWEFHTPAIFPRPNITCGYYSYLHDDITEKLPAGLAMQRLNNGSWIASFDHTLVNILDIPRENRLGCSVSVPNTTYKKIIKFEDSFTIDHLIDSEGCPAFSLEPTSRLEVNLNNAILNCRGDFVPTSSGTPAIVSFSCPESEFAAFRNGTLQYNWSIDLQCDPRTMTWITGSRSSNMINGTDLPRCVPRSLSGESRISAKSLTILSIHTLLLLTYYF